MLPKSSERVAEVIRTANRIAREYEQEYVGTEHLLLAILEEGTGQGAAVLAKRGATGDKLRARIEHLIREQMEETWVFGRLPGTPHFKDVMAAAIQECVDLGAKTVCTEHLLLALTRVKGCVAYKALSAMDIAYDAVRRDVMEMAST